MDRGFFAKSGYILLLAVRVYLCTSYSYIHPDEYFQGAEIMAGDILGVKHKRPWEFNIDFPCRSISPIYISSGFPITIFAKLSDFCGFLSKIYVVEKLGLLNDFNSSSMLFGVIRVYSVMMSMLCDFLLYMTMKNIKASRETRWKIMALYAMSHTTLVLLARPFSNQLETVLIASLFFIISAVKNRMECIQRRITHVNQDTLLEHEGLGKERYKVVEKWCRLFGVLFALGVFTRITFVLYGYILGISLLLILMQRYSFRISIKLLMQSFMFLVFSCLAMYLVDLVYFERVQFDGLKTTINFKSSVTILNNFIYNSKYENLKLHGIHPFYLYILVHFPLIFGPTLYLVYQKSLSLVRMGVSPFKEPFSLDTPIFIASILSPLSGLLLLSCIAHKELRFLLPSVIGIYLFLSFRKLRIPKLFWICSLVFNLSMFVVFGIFHESGVLPSIFYIRNKFHKHWEEKTRVDVFYIYTLSPPQSLFGVLENKDYLNIYESAGMNIETIRSFIDSQNLPLCANVAPALSSVTFTPVLSKKLFFVVFPDIYNPEFFKVGAESRVNFIKLHSFPHHIEFDEIGNYFSSSFKKIGLSLYCVCA